MPFLPRFDGLTTFRFLTVSTYRRLPLLARPQDRDLVVSLLTEWCVRRRIQLLAYVVMPEHLHLVLFPPDSLQLTREFGELKSAIATALFRRWEEESFDLKFNTTDEKGNRHLWQRRCYDHNCRDWESIITKIRYCHDNPVRRGLVSKQSEWKWSSVHWYDPIELTGGPLDMLIKWIERE